MISTAGNDEEYFGRQLGQVILGRPLERMVVMFDEDLNDDEFVNLRDLGTGNPLEKNIRDRMASVHAIKVHSIRVCRNFQH